MLTIYNFNRYILLLTNEYWIAKRLSENNKEFISKYYLKSYPSICKSPENGDGYLIPTIKAGIWIPVLTQQHCNQINKLHKEFFTKFNHLVNNCHYY